MELDRRKEMICPSCGLVKAKSQFHSNPVMNGHKYLMICKTCVNEKLKEYKKLLENDGAALWCLCMELGIPFIRSVWKDTYNTYIENNETAPNNNLFLIYMDYFLTLDKMPTGLWDTDMMLSDFFSDAHIIDKDINFQRIIDWGHYDVEDYEFLEAKMEEYTGQFKTMKPSQLNRYRDLCKAELRKRKLEEDPESQLKDVTAAGKEIIDLMKLLRIDNFQSDTRSEVEKQLEYQAAIMEQTKPCEDEDIMKYKDFCGCQKLEQQLMRPLRNLIAGTRDYPHITKE